MIDIVAGSIVASSYGDSEVGSGSLTISDLFLEGGDRFYILYHYRNVQNINIAAPVWNGQVAEAVVAPFDNNGLYRVQLYRIVAGETATADLSAQVEGDNAPSQFTFLVSTRFILRGEVAETAEVQLQSESVLTVAEYTAPELTFTDVMAGDLVVSLLATTAFDGDFNVESATWVPSNLSQQSTVTNATSNYSKIQQFGTATESATVGWTPSAGEPGWSHIGFVVKAAADTPTLIDINGDDTIEIGSEDNTLNTADLDVGFLSIGTLPVAITEIDPDQHTFTQPWFTDFETYPLLGTVQALAATGSDPEAPDYESATKNVTLQLPADWNGITYGLLSDAPDSLAAMIEGATIETGDVHYYRPADITLYDDSTFSDAPSGTVETWLRKSATNMMIQVLIINGVPVVPGGNWAPIEFIEKIDFIG